MTGVERRQVFDLPPVRAEVTEHQLIERECGCGQRTRAAAPPGADGPATYGPRVAAVVVYLYTGQFLSKKRTAQALAELFGIPLSSGTVASLTARAAGRLGGFLEHARKQIAGAGVAGFDETGFRVDGRLAFDRITLSNQGRKRERAPSRRYGRLAGVTALSEVPRRSGRSALSAHA